MKKRFALLIGASHSGTTRLFRLLGAHPQVLPCRVKEPRFFTDPHKWALGLDWYRSLWDFREPDERIGLEASTEYACHPEVESPASRIAATPTGFRFLYLLDDPLERIAAHHARRVAEGLAPASLGVDELAPCLAASRYATQLAEYRRHFPAEDFLLLRADRLRSEPRSVLSSICRFLEIDPYFAFPAGEAPASPARTAPAPRRGGRLRRWLRGRKRSPAPAPTELPARVREAALRELAGEIARLAEDWSFDVSGWSGAPDPPQPGRGSRR